MKIEELKKILSIRTSEELFDLPKQPEEQCPFIDEVIAELNDSAKALSQACKELQRIENLEYVEEQEQVIDSASYDIESLISNMESLRNNISSLREWGRSWKNIAIKLLESKEDVNEYMSNECYIRMESIKENQL